MEHLRQAGINQDPFQQATSTARLARHIFKTYDEFISPGFGSKEPPIDMAAAIDNMRMIFKDNLLCRLPSSKILSAVGVYKNWNKNRNPKGIIGFDILPMFCVTIPVEYSPNDYKVFQDQAEHWHDLLHTAWQPTRQEGKGIIPQDARIRKNMALLSNSLYFLRDLTDSSRTLIPTPGPSHTRVNGARTEIMRHQKNLDDAVAKSKMGPASQLLREEIIREKESLRILLVEYAELIREADYDSEDEEFERYNPKGKSNRASGLKNLRGTSTKSHLEYDDTVKRQRGLQSMAKIALDKMQQVSGELGDFSNPSDDKVAEYGKKLEKKLSRLSKRELAKYTEFGQTVRDRVLIDGEENSVENWELEVGKTFCVLPDRNLTELRSMFGESGNSLLNELILGSTLQIVEQNPQENDETKKQVIIINPRVKNFLLLGVTSDIECNKPGRPSNGEWLDVVNRFNLLGDISSA